MKTLFSIILLLLLVNSQALAVFCSSICSLPVTSIQNSGSSHDCHPPKKNPANESPRHKDGCENKICQIDEMVIIDNDFRQSFPLKSSLHFIDVTGFYGADSYPNASFSCSFESLARYGLHLKLPIFMQKASFLI